MDKTISPTAQHCSAPGIHSYYAPQPQPREIAHDLTQQVCSAPTPHNRFTSSTNYRGHYCDNLTIHMIRVLELEYYSSPSTVKTNHSTSHPAILEAKHYSLRDLESSLTIYIYVWRLLTRAPRQCIDHSVIRRQKHSRPADATATVDPQPLGSRWGSETLNLTLYSNSKRISYQSSAAHAKS